MKKLFALLVLLSLNARFTAQYLIVGKDSISLAQFKSEYLYGLQNNGIEKTLKSTEDFLLLQQFAEQKKVDTMAYFRERMMEKESDLRAKFFFPGKIIDPLISQYVQDNQTEKQVQIFLVQKTEGDTNNYKQIYADVKSGKITMDDAITRYAKGNPSPLYVKPGGMDNSLYQELKKLAPNSYTNLKETANYAAFAKVLGSRPSLGYMIFGTISYPKNESSDATKEKIYAELKSGKAFQEVAKLYGANDHEKNNGGVVMGSPTLPDQIYNEFKGKKAGYYSTEPILFGDNYFIFNIYNIEPYALTEKNKEFFKKEMSASLYSEMLQDEMVKWLKSDPTYKEFPEYQTIKKSYQNFAAAKESAVLYQYKNQKTTVGDIRKLIGDKRAEAEKMNPESWSDAIANVNNSDLIGFYSKLFSQQKEIKKELDEFKRGQFSDYVFSRYLTEEITKHPEWLTQYYNQNKSKFMWENRADGRVAIIADEKLVKDIEKEIKDPKKWEALKTKYVGKLNDKKQIIVNFEKGEMVENADVFTKYKVPFKTGVFQTKMGERSLVIAIDKILPPTEMTQDEASELLKDAVTEQKLQEIIAEQKAKTKITIQPAFMADLEKNFKK